MKNNFDAEILNKIKNILLKKSEGFYYNEEILEYQNNSTEIKNTENNQLNFLENNEKNTPQKHSNLTLLKKKVTSHYVPPDLLAVKMLIEIFGETLEHNDLSYLSDTELNNLKLDIIKKLEEN